MEKKLNIRRGGIIIFNMGRTYDTTNPITETLIEECGELGEKKLKDNIFEDICQAYKMEEYDVMDLMCKVPRSQGVFKRISNGWIFRKKII